MEQKDLDNLKIRALLVMTNLSAEQYRGILSCSTKVDVERDCVAITAGGAVVAELGLEESVLSDHALYDLLRAATMKNCGPGYPPPTKEPML